MSFSKISFFVALLTATLLSGCSTSRFDSNDSGNTLEVFYPLQQIPTEVMSDVSSSRSLASEAADASMYEKGDSQSDGRMASLELPSTAVDLFPASIAGVWNLSVGGKVCRIATPQTKFGQGFRAGPLHCPGIVSQVNSWAVKGKRLYFYNNSGRVIVALYSSNVGRFEGRTLDDHPVVLSR
ncbi:AprI/Inh family metalloprotease inhibitor [Bartonella sp. B39]